MVFSALVRERATRRDGSRQGLKRSLRGSRIVITIPVLTNGEQYTKGIAIASVIGRGFQLHTKLDSKIKTVFHI